MRPSRVKPFSRFVFPSAAFLIVACAAHGDAGPVRPYVPPPGLSGLGAPGPGALGAPYQVGLATWYGQSFAGKKTSNGERFDPEAMTAANRKLPFGTWVEVRRIDTGSAVRVRINDRGPFGDSRKVIDLSYRAAKLLGFVEMGAVKVEIRVVEGP
jgi:rare lipoprotein A